MFRKDDYHTIVKLRCFILAAYCFFHLMFFPGDFSNENIENADSYNYSISFNLVNPNDFYDELEKLGINTENTKEYEIKGVRLTFVSRTSNFLYG